jgi:hypothetical protein
MRIIRRSTLTGLACALGCLVLSSAAALAAAPEAPVTREAKSIAGASAMLRGELNPGATGVDLETEEYEFAYAPVPAGCTEGQVAPELPQKALGDPGESVSETVKGLEPGREYDFCVVALHEGEPAYGQQLTFKTAPFAAPRVDGESATAVGSTAATLEAQVNPDGQTTSYELEYSTEGKTGAGEKLEGTIVTVAGKGTLPALYEYQSASVPTGALLAGTTYYYRVVASNATPPATDGIVQAFTTVPLPQGVKAEAVTATTATLTGELTPLNEAVGTKYDFAYNVGASCSGGLATPGGEEPAGNGTGTALVTEPVTALEPNAAYTVCLVSSNVFGSETSTPVHFNTPAAAPVVEAPNASGVTPTEAGLEATVDPNNQKTTCEFQYGETTSYGTDKPCSPATLEGYGARRVSLALSGLTPGKTYDFRVLVENAKNEKGEVAGEVVIPALEGPDIESESAPVVTPTEAKLETRVNPKYQQTTCVFEYASSEPLLNAGVTTVPCPAELGSGGGGVGASVVLAGLAPKTVYYYRVSAKNGTGTEKGTIDKFETETKAPIIESEGFLDTSVTQTGVKLEAQVNPNYQETTYSFQYATEESVLLEGHGTTVLGGTLPAGSIPTGFGEHSAHAFISGLQPNTAYYYRVVASNAVPDRQRPDREHGWQQRREHHDRDGLRDGRPRWSAHHLLRPIRQRLLLRPADGTGGSARRRRPARRGDPADPSGAGHEIPLPDPRHQCQSREVQRNLRRDSA